MYENRNRRQRKESPSAFHSEPLKKGRSSAFPEEFPLEKNAAAEGRRGRAEREREKRKGTLRTLASVFCALLFLAGLSVLLYPTANRIVDTLRCRSEAKNFEQYTVELREEAESVQAAEENSEEAASSLPQASQRIFPKLYEAMQAYNLQLFSDRQSGMKSMDSFTLFPIDPVTYGFQSENIGVLKIDAMELVLPVYLGATNENMAKGAAVMGETSLPIGGENTNCVLVAHRGWKGTAKFREIEKLQIGDDVYLENPWETLHYRVSEIEIILPDQFEKVLIREGRDMITLVTCHPYRHNTHRYVVYCDRVNEDS